MKGGYFNPNSQLNASIYVPTPNGIGASENGVAVNGTLSNQLNYSDSPSMAMSNAIDKISPAIMASSQTGANSIQNGGGRRQNQNQNQNQNQYQNQFQQQNQRQYQNQNQYQNQFQQQNQRQYQNQNQQQNQRGGVWNQMIGEAVAPLVLLGLQQYYGPRSKSNRGNRSTKGKRTRRYRK
jgi:hypothetical protein